MTLQNPRLAVPPASRLGITFLFFCFQDKLDKENVAKKAAPDPKVEKDATADDLFSAHNFDITIDLGESGETGEY